MSDLRHCVFLKDSFNYWCTTRPDVYALKISSVSRSHKRLYIIDGCLKTECFLYVCVDFFCLWLTKLYKYIVWAAIQMISRRTWLDHVNITRKTLLRESQNLLLPGSLRTLRWNISYKIANINSSVSAGVIDSQYGQEHIMYGNDPIPSRAYDFANFHVSDHCGYILFMKNKSVRASCAASLLPPSSPSHQDCDDLTCLLCAVTPQLALYKTTTL